MTHIIVKAREPYVFSENSTWLLSNTLDASVVERLTRLPTRFYFIADAVELRFTCDGIDHDALDVIEEHASDARGEYTCGKLPVRLYLKPRDDVSRSLLLLRFDAYVQDRSDFAAQWMEDHPFSDIPW